MSTFSVLLCTYNRPTLLAQCLRALVDHTTEKPDQIVVVNGGDERADRIVQEFSVLRPSSSVEILLVKTVNKNLAASRNVGLPYCAGEIIAMTDDDAEVFPDWVTQMKRIHAKHPNVGVAGGAIIGADTHSLVSCISDRVTFGAYPTARAVRTVPGVNVSYKRQVVEQVGWQDETLFRGEDVDYNWRAQKLGWTVWYDPCVRVLHHHRSTLRGFLHQHYMYGRAYYLVRHKHPEMYCIYPHSFKRPKDFLKAIHFLAAILYEPFIYAARMEWVTDKLLTVPILLANGVVWRSGMIRQKFIA